MRSSCSSWSDMLSYESKSYLMRSIMLQSRTPLSSLILGTWEDLLRDAWTWLMMVHSM